MQEQVNENNKLKVNFIQEIKNDDFVLKLFHFKLNLISDDFCFI